MPADKNLEGVILEVGGDAMRILEQRQRLTGFRHALLASSQGASDESETILLERAS